MYCRIFYLCMTVMMFSCNKEKFDNKTIMAEKITYDIGDENKEYRQLSINLVGVAQPRFFYALFAKDTIINHNNVCEVLLQEDGRENIEYLYITRFRKTLENGFYYMNNILDKSADNEVQVRFAGYTCTPEIPFNYLKVTTDGQYKQLMFNCNMYSEASGNMNITANISGILKMRQ